jgi:hypothetical protein
VTGSADKAKAYRARNPRKSPLWQCVNSHYTEFERVYGEIYEKEYGPFRREVTEVTQRFLKCGDPRHGFARVRCDHCRHEYLLPFSCKCRGFCPSCQQRKVQTTAQFIVAQIVAPVPHRLYTLTIPKMLRKTFRRNRYLLKRLYDLAYESLRDYLRTAMDCPDGMPGAILALHTFGEYGNFHPHIHALVADGLFIQRSRETASKGTGISDVEVLSKMDFLPRAQTAINSLKELFRAKVISFLVSQNLLSPENVRVLDSWKCSGFNVHAGDVVPADATVGLQALAQYILRNPFSVEKMMLKSEKGAIIYHSQFNVRIKRNFEVFKPLDFLATITQHIPNKGAQTVHYYGQYSNKSRGMRRKSERTHLTVCGPVAFRRVPSKRWSELIMHAWHVDPLRCPICEKHMRIVAIINDPPVIEKILRHRHAWHDPPAMSSPTEVPESYRYEPCDDVDPMPDYESFSD